MKNKIVVEPNRFDVDIKNGLNKEQVDTRNKQGLTNVTRKKSGKSYFSIFMGNIFTFFNLLGIIIMILMLAVGSWSNMFFFIVILSNTVIGIFQEIRAKLSIEKLQLMAAPTSVVVRDGEQKEVDVKDIVLDDIIIFDLGKQITTDSVVLEGEVETNEAILTGESVPVKKKKGDLLLSGSFVVSGKCYAKAERVGNSNYIETLSSKAKQYKKPNSELLNSINKIIKGIAIVIFPLGFLTFLTAMKNNGGEIAESIVKASGSMIGMIPSGMVLLISVTLTVSVIKLAQKKTVVQDLFCIEMLARVNTLCLDKTGTITDGTMSVESVVEYEKLDGYDTSKLVSMVLDATKDNNATAEALKKKFYIESNMVSSTIIPFSSSRKYSGAGFEGVGTLVLGAPEFVMKKGLPQNIAKQMDLFLKEGLRVIMLAHVNKVINEDDVLEDVKPLALFAIQDTIRSDAVEIIKWFKDNDVRVKVISGDNPLSVSVIAKKVGIENAQDYISLDGLTDEEVKAAATKYTVFGRVTPDQKALLIKAMHENGETVAMTGDGVNDILAMKEADCAIAIASGSAATRNVAHLVLMDSKFSSMPSVVKEGRQVINNVQNSATLFLMKTIMTMLTTITMLILQKDYPFEPKHLYVIEFLVIGYPSFCLALRSNNALIKGNFFKSVLSKTLPIGISLYLNVLLVYIFQGTLGLSDAQVTTMAMISMTFAGCMGLLWLCEPFTKITSLIGFSSLFASFIGFFVFNAILKEGSPFIVALTTPMIIFVLAEIVLAFLIINLTPIITKKVKLLIERRKANA